MNTKALMVATAVLAIPSMAHAAPASVPVMTDPVSFTDTVCHSVGTIKVDSFVSVRMGPGVRFKEIDKVHDGLHFAICDERKGWYGIVYDEWNGVFDDSDYCHLTVKRDSNKKSHPYHGPCRHGWINKKFVTDLAG